MRINCILLAAGKSSRFKENKLLVNFKGKPLIMHTIEKVKKQYELNNIMIVTQYEEIAKLAKDQGISVLENKCIEKGLSYSLHLGVLASGDCDGYMFMVCDQPLLSSETISQMLKLFELSGKGIVCASSNGMIGNPSIFSSRYKDEILKTEGDVGGRYIIRNHLEDVMSYEVWDEAELIDIDSINDLEYIKTLRE